MYWKWRNCFLFNPRKRAELFIRSAIVFFWHLKHITIFPIDELLELRLTLASATLGCIEIGYERYNHILVQAIIADCAICSDGQVHLDEVKTRPYFRGFDKTISFVADFVRTNQYKEGLFSRHYSWEKEIGKYWREASVCNGEHAYDLFAKYELNVLWNELVNGVGYGVGHADIELGQPGDNYDVDDEIKLGYIRDDVDAILLALRAKGLPCPEVVDPCPPMSLFQGRLSATVPVDHSGCGVNFCCKCGSKRLLGANFCAHCGQRFE